MGQAVMRVVSGQAQVYGRILGATDGPQHLVSSPFTALLLITNPSHELPAEVLLSSLWNGMEHLALRSGGRFIGFVSAVARSLIAGRSAYLPIKLAGS